MPSRPNTGNGTPPIVDMGAYEMAPGLITVVKTVDIGGVTNVPLGGVVTYTLVIRNDGDDVVSGVVVTDPMPIGLTFGQWLERGSAQLPPPITWGPFDVVAHTAYTLSFTANVTENVAFAGQVITNTAYFDTASDVSGTSNPVTFTVVGPALNQPPVADAGADRTVSVSSTVTLDGSGSTDPDGDDLLYGWVQTGGGAGISFTPNVSVTTFTAPGSADVLTFALTVTDTGSLTGTATVVITVTESAVNRPPVANAGLDRTVVVSSTVTLDGSGSTDPDGDDLLYGWVQTGGGAGISFTPNISVTTFTAPGSADVLTFTLTVTDTGNLTDTATVVITVTEHSIYLPTVLRQHS
jgi:uncharacterized repeat protein (TIGR01451 family)